MEPYLATITPFCSNYAPDGYLMCWGQQLTIQQYEAVYAVVGTLYGGNGTTNFNLPDLQGRAMIGYGSYTGTVPTTFNLGTKIGATQASLSVANMPLHNHSAQLTLQSTSQSVTIPAQTGGGSLSATVSVPIHPTAVGAAPQNNATNFLCATGSGMSRSGPYTQQALPATPTASLNAVTAPVTASSDYVPAIPAHNVNLNLPSTGTVAVGNAGGSTPISLMQPSLVVSFLFAVQGLFPVRP